MTRNTDLSLAGRVKNSYSTYFDLDEIGSRLSQKKIEAVTEMARMSNSGITIFDMQTKTHIYTSRSFYEIHGYELNSLGAVSNENFDRKIHPQDLVALKKNGRRAMQYMESIHPDFRKDYKMISEYRISTKNQSLIRVTEQQQVLEQDASGKTWLSLGILDIAPDQSHSDHVKFQIINMQTGKLVNLPDAEEKSPIILTIREKEVLEMIGHGMLSKEVSSLLDISIHTVNTHRQRILEKLEVNNSIEALHSARSLGLIA